ncbi:hypothetical protein AA106556_0751 [Neokomagataea tanensis NBRC 106556]|uniref:DUF3465 domain-containing protein n=2 Tax=Acetobacteraceae TaxID=433 RepID=A0ABQ0QHW6_9PROT|nr:hypothetical protein AA106556_0751 [Neokomagataea tanensis NBRC 106556]
MSFGRKFYKNSLIVSFILMLSAGMAHAASETMPSACDNAQFLRDQQNFLQNGATGVDLPEHICGHVVAVAPRARQTRSGLHGFFYVNVGSGVSIRIVSDLDRMNAPSWPWVHKQDQVEVQGRYYFDNLRSQGIDWTHHGTGRSWAWGGFVVVNGQHYE